MLANLAGFDPKTDALPIEQLLPLDRWILGQAHALQSDLRTAYDEYQFHHVYHRLHNFCSGELGGFYLDIIKDRQYTTASDSLARRSAQTSLFHLAEALCRWIAPILSFTAEELWENIPGDRADSVFLTEWYDALPVPETEGPLNADFWSEMMGVRQQVNKALELAREQGSLRGSLDAAVTLYAEHRCRAPQPGRTVLFHHFGSHGGGDEQCTCRCGSRGMALRIRVKAAASEKCERCWHRRPDVSAQRSPELCGRCVTNIDGPGEVREFA